MKNASWRGSAMSIACSLALAACGGGGGGSDAPTASPSAKTDTTVPTPSPAPSLPTVKATAGQVTTMSASTGASVQVSGSTAALSVPANALVVAAATSQTASGNVSVLVAPVNPAADPLSMYGGRYDTTVPGTSQRQALESFGAVNVDIQQNSTLLDLAAGKTATLRIPVATRSSERPATLPLYYFDEANLLWVPSGTATLQGNASTGYYYEGQISRLGFWNADKPIGSTVTVQGCVKTSAGVAALAQDFEAYSEGVSYSSVSWAPPSTGGKFSVPVKKGATARVVVMANGKREVRELGQVDNNTVLPECFTIQDDTPPPPTPVPTDVTTLENFSKLIDALMAQTLSLALAPSAAFDGETLVARSSDQVCAKGSVTNLTLDGQATDGHPTITADAKHVLALSFKQCVPMDNVDDDVPPVFTGTASSSFSFSQSADGQAFKLSSANVLNQLQDSANQYAANGNFKMDLSSTATIDQFTLTPTAGATLTHMGKDTVTFKSGVMVMSFQAVDAQTTITTLSANKLTYVLQGSTYVLDGTMKDGKGTLTLSKDGVTAATLDTTSATPKATGTVTLF